MHEVLSESIALVNLPFSVLLVIVMGYWLLVALGALDAQMGGDVDGDFDGDGHVDGGWLAGVFHFINLGDVPIMVVLSVLTVCLWTCSLLSNYYFTDHRALLALAFLLPNLAVSTVATRYLTLPLKPIFRFLRRDGEDAVEVIGQPCRITTSSATEIFGQAEIETKGAPLLIDVRTLGGATLPRGTRAVVVREDKERGIYFVVEVPTPQLS